MSSVIKSSRKLTAIVVEDEEGPRHLLKRLLERRHAELVEVIAEADEGPAGLVLCQQRQPDLIFLDLNLPGFDGLELLSRLRAPSQIILTTADSRRAVDIHRALAIDYLLKPVDPEQLERAVARAAAAITTRAT